MNVFFIFIFLQKLGHDLYWAFLNRKKMELIRLENEIKALLQFRLTAFEYDIVIVEAYQAMDMTTICRIELFLEKRSVESRIAKYEGEVKKAFYFEAEKSLIQQISKNRIEQAV